MPLHITQRHKPKPAGCTIAGWQSGVLEECFSLEENSSTKPSFHFVLYYFMKQFRETHSGKEATVILSQRARRA